MFALVYQSLPYLRQHRTYHQIYQNIYQPICILLCCALYSPSVLILQTCLARHKLAIRFYTLYLNTYGLHISLREYNFLFSYYQAMFLPELHKQVYYQSTMSRTFHVYYRCILVLIEFFSLTSLFLSDIVFVACIADVSKSFIAFFLSFKAIIAFFLHGFNKITS